MDEKYKLEEYLTLTKSLISLYLNAMVESSNEIPRNVFMDGLNCTLELQNNIYNTLVNLGYYKVENVNTSVIESLIQKLNQDC